jgi:Protein of unknown function
MYRQKIEKDLQLGMEGYATRSVMDPELDFHAPVLDDGVDGVGEEELTRNYSAWPITIRWPDTDPRSKTPDNHDGEMRPDLLLRYGVEKIQLPQGDNMFRWLTRQQTLQNYFIPLFWLIKLKFFQHASIEPNDEEFLLKLMGAEYVKLIELLASRARVENEKDFVFKYLPYIYATSVFFGFYYMCPGSRHLYTKGFRKTLYMQVVQVMFGIQPCPLAIKATWGRFFPEEAHDDEDVEDGQETIPVNIALFGSQQVDAKVKQEKLEAAAAAKALARHKSASFTDSPSYSRSQSYGGLLAEGGTVASENGGMSPTGNLNPNAAAAMTADGQISNLEAVEGAGFAGLSWAMPMLPDSPEFVTRPQTAGSSVPPNRLKPLSTTQRVIQDPLSRTHLRSMPEKPRSLTTVASRQHVEPLDALEISPMVQQHFPDGVNSKSQLMLRRTVPVNWCSAGGTDTYRKSQVPKELHDDISAKAKKAQRDFHHLSGMFHNRKLKIKLATAKQCQMVLHSGQTKVSRYCLDLIKRRAHASSRGGEAAIAEPEVFVEQSVAGANPYYDDDAIDEYIQSI